MKAIASGLHLCPGCCEKRIPAQRDLCFLCEALSPEEFATTTDKINDLADGVSVAVENVREDYSTLSKAGQLFAKASGAIAFALLISSPFWLRALYEFFTGAMK